jgi:hypothetical protein
MKRLFTLYNISVYADEHLDILLSDVKNTSFTVVAGDSHKLRLEYNIDNTKWYLYDDVPDRGYSAGSGVMDTAITVCLEHGLYVAMYNNKVYFSKDVCKLRLMAWELEEESFQEQEEVPEEVPYP